MNKSLILIVACVCLTIFSGLLRGRIDARWGISEKLDIAAQSVESVPLKLGSWDASQHERLDEAAQKMLRCSGSVVSSYANPAGELISMVYLVGPAGPLAVHTPQVCYGSNNFSPLSKRQLTIADSAGKDHEFSVVTFAENKAGNRLLRVYYAWNYENKWVAPATPRTSFAGIPMLYKIQIATNSVDTTKKEMDAGERFLRENLEQINEYCK